MNVAYAPVPSAEGEVPAGGHSSRRIAMVGVGALALFLGVATIQTHPQSSLTNLKVFKSGCLATANPVLAGYDLVRAEEAAGGSGCRERAVPSKTLRPIFFSPLLRLLPAPLFLPPGHTGSHSIRAQVEYFNLDAGSAGVAGSSDYQATYGDHGNTYTFYFSTEANQKTFEADPTRYLPQNGGFCSWGIAAEDWWTEASLGPSGNPDVWEIIDDKLYFFMFDTPRDKFMGLESSDDLDKSADTAAYITAAAERWEDWFDGAAAYNTACLWYDTTSDVKGSVSVKDMYQKQVAGGYGNSGSHAGQTDTATSSPDPLATENSGKVLPQGGPSSAGNK